MDPNMIPEAPTVREADNRRFVYFKKTCWTRADIERYLEGAYPGYVKATWFDQGDVHKIVVELPQSGRKTG